MFDFEKLHKNHKLAYLDGVLCGIVGMIIAKQFYNDYREYKANEKFRLECIAEKNTETTES